MLLSNRFIHKYSFTSSVMLRIIVATLLAILLATGFSFISAHRVAAASDISAEWRNVGNPGFSSSQSYFNSIAMSGATPYVAFTNWDNDQINVMKYQNGSWVNLGSPGFSGGDAYDTHIAFDGDTPYVAFVDELAGYGVTVMKYVDNVWQVVGTRNISVTDVEAISFVISNGTPYVAYTAYDGGDTCSPATTCEDGRVSVRKFVGSSWVAAGSLGISSGVAHDLDLAVSNDGTPYVVYTDEDQGNKATLMKLNGATWQPVGNAGFTSGEAYSPRIAIDGTTPYVAFIDGDFNSRASVMKYNGSSWSLVGIPGFTNHSVDYNGPYDANTLDIAINNHLPYIVYYTYGFSGGAPADASLPYGLSDGVDDGDGSITVRVYDGSGWRTLGNANFSVAAVTNVSITFGDNMVPYVTFSDDSRSDKATVMRFESNTVGVPLPSGISNQIVVQTPVGSAMTCSEYIRPSDIEVKDRGYSYPLGIVNYCFQAVGNTNLVSITFQTDMNPNEFVARKYNPNTGKYADIPGAQITRTTLNGKNALKLTYIVVDNGPLDTDPQVGSIEDPVGLATADKSKFGAPDTGIDMISLVRSVTNQVLLGVGTLVVFGIAYKLSQAKSSR